MSCGKTDCSVSAHPNPVVHPLSWLLTVLGLWQQRYRQRTKLSALEDSHLDDIGLSRDQAAREASKRFWRD